MDRSSSSTDDDETENLVTSNHELNVGGKSYSVSTVTLTKIPDTYFTELLRFQFFKTATYLYLKSKRHCKNCTFINTWRLNFYFAGYVQIGVIE